MASTLIIKPIRAKLTRDTDFLSKMDPYCKIIISSQTFKTDACKGGGRYFIFILLIKFINL
jgi:hypothetical protein